MQNKNKTRNRIMIIILLTLTLIISFVYFINKSDYFLVLLYENSSTDIVREFSEIKGIKYVDIKEINFVYAENLRLSLHEKKQFEQKIKQISKEFGFSKMRNISGFLENSTSIISDIEPSNSDVTKSGMWYMNSIKNLNKTNYTGRETKITIIDSGIDLSIEFINKNLDLNDSQSYLKNDKSLIDRTGHGTMVSGIISTIAPNSNIVMYKVTSEKENANSIVILKAIIDAVRNGSDAINISLGTFIDSKSETGNILIKAFQKAVDYSIKNNVLIFSSAGNVSINLDDLKNDGIIYVPAMLKNVVAINAINKSNTIASYSNFGNYISFSMPGGDFNYINGVEDEKQKILVYFPNYLLEDKNEKKLTASTSIATPMATGVYSLYLEKLDIEELDVLEILNIIIKDSEDLGKLGKDVLYGYGKMVAPIKNDN